jgi:hypothetical protein
MNKSRIVKELKSGDVIKLNMYSAIQKFPLQVLRNRRKLRFPKQ